ncbi:hypothetical protein ACR74O_09565 [Faecalicoccus pleomorphus]|nr:hypothetical protein [Faecalicoccus pleomorphus]
MSLVLHYPLRRCGCWNSIACQCFFYHTTSLFFSIYALAQTTPIVFVLLS